ncbi:uncharacterized protein LOC143826513 [Paroedura picta]|uniref:uncharacterized protein LOC143826513 n=1 Tax=Paroedura picta TaxID=143630 RepID=UPI0040566512
MSALTRGGKRKEKPEWKMRPVKTSKERDFATRGGFEILRGLGAGISPTLLRLQRKNGQPSGRPVNSPILQGMLGTSLLLSCLLDDTNCSVFVQGEKVQLTCSPPGRRRAEEFLFYKLNPRNQWDRLMRQKEDTWEVSITHQEQEITFICTYAKRNRAGELLQSAPSNLSVVSIIGQGPYRAFEVDPNAAGKYSCTYWMLFSGREIRSPHSGLSAPRPPLFSVSPEQEVYSSGEVLSLRCLTPGGLQVSEVTFLKDSQRLHLTRLPASPGNFTHAFPISPQDGGKYSCKYLAVKSGREIPSLASNVLRIAVMAIPVTEPWPATLNVHTYETVAGVTNSPGVPASLAPDQLAARENSGATEAHGPATPVPRSSQLIPHDSNSSSTESRGSTKPVDSQEPTKPVDSWVSTNLVDSWVSTKPVDSRGSTKPVDSWVSTNLVDSWISTKLFDSSISRKTSIDSSDLGSTSQTRTVSGAEDRNGVLSTGGNLNFPLVVGCSAAGILFLVLLLVCLTRRKLKGNRKRASRSFWENLDDHHFRKLSRIYHPNRTHLDLQEIAKPQEADQDQVILPKPADVSSSCGDPSIQSQADDNADFGAEFKFPAIDLTYTLLGYPCSTFLQAKSSSPAKDTHLYEETL